MLKVIQFTNYIYLQNPSYLSEIISALILPFVDGRSKPRPESSLPHLPVVEAYQRHELTLLRMEDILNHGSESSSGQQGSGPVSSAAELCHRMVDFCQVSL